MITNLIYLISNLFYLYIVYKLMNSFFEKSTVSRVILYTIYIIYYTVISLLHLSLMNPIVNLAINIISLFLLTFFHKASFKKRLFIVSVIYIILFVCEELAFIISNLISNNNDIIVITTLISSKVLSYTLTLLISNIIDKKNYIDLPLINWLAIFILPIGTLFLTVMILINYKIYNNILILISIIILFLINIIVFFIYDFLHKAYNKLIEKELLKKQLSSYAKQFEIIRHTQDNNKILIHDTKNHLNVINSFISLDKKNKALDYISKLSKDIQQNNSYIITGNIEVDSILNYKRGQALKNNINIEIDSKIPQDLKITAFDLNVILGNLLDNAIEALVKENDKSIQLKILLEKNILYIYVSNQYHGSLNYIKGNLITNKENKNLHSYGLKSVEKIIDKYNGDITMKHDNSLFEVSILIYNI